MRACIAYINYTKKLRIFNILNYFCVVYIMGMPNVCAHHVLVGSEFSPKDS